ncbi:hypothetical protein JXA88_16360 [Candidatus Fermentibacteria bacterium]|nr:hypothetical protein [Candidatus Fermentibacteria bacterium]
MTARHAFLLLVILVACGLVSYAVILHRTPWLFADETMYARAAWNLAHRGLVFPDVPGAMNYPPLYPAILAPASLAPDIRIAYAGYQAVNIALWIAGGVLAYAIAVWTKSAVPAPLVAAAFLATPAAVAYVPLIMSENLSIVLLQVAAISLYRVTTGGGTWWLLAGWVCSLAAPFCRVTGVVAPLAFFAGVAPRGFLAGRALRWCALITTVIAGVLLVVLPTSVLRIYHPLATASVAAKTLLTAHGWRTLAQNSGTTLAMVIVGSAGFVWLLLAGGPPEQKPIRRFLGVVVGGQALLTIAYQQYGSAGPNAQIYRVIGRYVDTGIAVTIPWLLSLRSYPRRMHVMLPAAGAALAVFMWPEGGFKLGQTLATAGLGLFVMPFPSILNTVPVGLCVAIVALACPAIVMISRGRGRTQAAVLCLALFAPLAYEALAHEVAMSRRREAVEPALWRLHATVPQGATVALHRAEASPELWTALYSGLFWLPSAHVQELDHVPDQWAGTHGLVLVSNTWRPLRILHASSHKWYMIGQSPPPVEYSRSFYNFGPGNEPSLFSAPPADGSHARWSGDSPVIELHMIPGQWRIGIGLHQSADFGRTCAMARLNGHLLGTFTSADSVVSFMAHAETMRPDGRQLLTLRASPLDERPSDELWRHGVRLDWVAVEPGTDQTMASTTGKETGRG